LLLVKVLLCSFALVWWTEMAKEPADDGADDDG